MPLSLLRFRVMSLLAVLAALAVVVAACNGSDDDSSDQSETTAQTQQQSEDEDAQAQSDDEPSQPQEREQAEARADEQAQAQAEEAEEQADDGAGPAVVATLGDLPQVLDLRFEGAITLDLTPNTPGGDLDLVTAFSDIVLDGAFAAPGDFELAIRLDAAAGFPPLGIASVGGTLYTNLGFGWEQQEGGVGGLLELFDLSVLGLAPGAVDVEGVEDIEGLEGIQGLLPSDFSLDAWDDEGVEDLDFGPARHYKVEEDSLEQFIVRVAGDALGEGGGLLDLSMLEDLEAEVGLARIDVWLDEATGALAAFGLRIEGLSVANFDDEGTTLTAGRVTVLIEMQPELGLPVQLASDVEDLELLGPDGLTGDIRITFQTSDVNAGTVQIEPPV